MNQIRSFPLTGERPDSRKPVTISPDLIRAVKDATLILADHGWHNAKELRKIARENHIGYESLLLALQPAQSDNDKYLCLPGKDTPDIA